MRCILFIIVLLYSLSLHFLNKISACFCMCLYCSSSVPLINTCMNHSKEGLYSSILIYISTIKVPFLGIQATTSKSLLTACGEARKLISNLCMFYISIVLQNLSLLALVKSKKIPEKKQRQLERKISFNICFISAATKLQAITNFSAPNLGNGVLN